MPKMPAAMTPGDHQGGAHAQRCACLRTCSTSRTPGVSSIRASTASSTGCATADRSGAHRQHEEARHLAGAPERCLARRRCSPTATPAPFASDPFFTRGVSPGATELLASAERQKTVSLRCATSRSTRRSSRLPRRTSRRSLMPACSYGAGTDSGPPGRFPGFFEHWELQLMVEAGLTPRQALDGGDAPGGASCSAPRISARSEPTKWADFVVLDANPLADIRNSRKIRAVYIAGQSVPYDQSTRELIEEACRAARATGVRSGACRDIRTRIPVRRAGSEPTAHRLPRVSRPRPCRQPARLGAESRPSRTTGRRLTSRTPSSPICWPRTAARPTGSRRSSTTTRCTPTTSRWARGTRRRAA